MRITSAPRREDRAADRNGVAGRASGARARPRSVHASGAGAETPAPMSVVAIVGVRGEK